MAVRLEARLCVSRAGSPEPLALELGGGGLLCATLAGPPGARAPGDGESWLGEEVGASWVR